MFIHICKYNQIIMIIIDYYCCYDYIQVNIICMYIPVVPARGGATCHI